MTSKTQASQSFQDIEILIKTSKGDIRLALFSSAAPVTVANFLNLAQRGYYDGVQFHRVIAGFMMQGGDPTGTGAGGPGYSFEDEFTPELRFDRAGLLAMANRGPATNGSQFFITYVPTPHLNDHHTIFGEVREGADVTQSIRQGDTIDSVTILGDAATLFSAQASRISDWNSHLDG
ncbi:MAG: peptidylprolyl isomerase [Nevskiaceae bacterium]|nr:MAG: peptidylprolyl isomerase [Nevskiaceae bacterium]TBR72974.1 MAG: peptidylprolyl isomerase [Nevskiaceae bacterium]